MLVTLPSGAVAPLTEPGLLPLLASDGSLRGVVRAALVHAEVDADYLTDEDAYCVALWAIEHFAESPEGVALANTCATFGELPSRRLGLTEASLAWALDVGCCIAMRRREEEEPEEQPDMRVKFSVPDIQGDEDD